MFSTATVNRFWAKVDQSGACWLWTGALTSRSYGNFGTGGRNYLAHRFAYILAHGEPAEGTELDHLCRNRQCVNPAHLEAVSHGENVRRGASAEANKRRGAEVTHCPKGHEYTPENTRIRRGTRDCIACRNEGKRAARRRATTKRESEHG